MGVLLQRRFRPDRWKGGSSANGLPGVVPWSPSPLQRRARFAPPDSALASTRCARPMRSIAASSSWLATSSARQHMVFEEEAPSPAISR